MAFTGRAAYSNFAVTMEDVADRVSMITPHETMFLDYLGDADLPAISLNHEWVDDELAPNSIVTSSAIASAATDTAVGIVGGKAAYLQVNDILRHPDTGEYFQITVIAGNTITLSRGFGGTTATSAAIATTLDVISAASLEGEDVTQDSSTLRSRRNNYVQLFKRDIIVSGTQEAVSLHGGIEGEFQYQRTKKLTEALVGLERAVIMGILSGNSIGTATKSRTMNGVRTLLTTNVRSVGPALTESWFGTAIQDAWNRGGTDINLALVGVNYKRIIDSWNNTVKLVRQDDPRYVSFISRYESTFGPVDIMLNRWLPANEGLILASPRIKVVPLQKRSFFFREVVSQGDSRKGFVAGEYTVELRQEEGMSRIK